MCEALEQRITDIEELIGINNISNFELLDFDIVSLRKRLQDVDAGFVMQIPVEKLQRLKKFYMDVGYFKIYLTKSVFLKSNLKF